MVICSSLGPRGRRVSIPAVSLMALATTVAGVKLIAADDSLERASLKGLSSIRVEIDGPSAKDAAAVGLNSAALQKNIEVKIKKAGLTPLAPGERAQGMPFLYLSVRVFPADQRGDGLLVYSLDLSVIQEVRLSRSPGIRVPAPTWKVPGTIGTIKIDEARTLQSAIDQYVDNFVTAYHAANKE